MLYTPIQHIYSVEVLFKLLMTEVRILDVLRLSKEFNSKHQNLMQSYSPLLFFVFLTIFWNLANYIICKDAAFDSGKDLRNEKRTTGKKWERSPLFIAMFLLSSLGFILRFGRVYPQPYPTAICGYLKFQFNHRNIKFKYIYRFTLSHLCYIDELIFP